MVTGGPGKAHHDLKVNQRLYFYACHVTRCYDGDTMTVTLDHGRGLKGEQVTLRWYAIDAPELRGQERPQGLQVRDYVHSYVLNKSVMIRTHLDPRGKDRTGKYGRLLAEVFPHDADGQLFNLNQHLVETGRAEHETYGDPFWGWTQP